MFAENSANSAYGVVICVSLAMVFYFIIDDHTEPENFTMSTEIVETDTLDLGNTSYQLFLPHDMKMELYSYELSLSEMWDYTVYRVFIDFVNYIEIRNSKYDSLDAKPEQLEIEK